MGKLIPQTLLSDIPDLYETENLKDPLCCAKLFTPDSNWSWYIIECSKSDLNICYGYVVGLDNELGYFTIEELESLRGSLSLKVEVDSSFTPTLLSIVKKIVQNG
jgi:hypothetical protein